MNRDVKLLLISRIFRSIATGSLVIIIPLYYLYIHLSYFEIGILFSLATIFNPLLALIFSIYSDRYSRKFILLLNLILLPISIIILLFSGNNFALLSIASIIGGLGIAGSLVGGGVGANVTPIMNALLSDYIKDKNELTKTYSLFFSFSAIFGSIGALLANIRSFYDIFIIDLLLSFISFILVLFITDVRSNKELNEEIYKEIRKNDIKYIKIFSMTGIFNGFAQGFVASFIPIVLNKQFLIPRPIIGDLYFIGGILSGIILFLTPLLNKIFGFLRLIIITRGISTIFLLLIPFSKFPIIAEIFYLLYVLFRVISLPVQQALMVELIKFRKAESISINQISRLIPSAIASSITGYVLAISFIFPFILSSIFNFSNLFIYYFSFKDVPEANRKEIDRLYINE